MAVHSLLLEAFGQVAGAVPPGQGLGQVIHEYRVQAQGLAHVAHRAAGAVGDEGGGEGGPLAGVLPVDVLDHLLAPFVFEIHVDVRGFVALPRDETLEQQGNLLRRNLGDKQAVAHHRVGRRAAALAQDVPLPGEAHDVVHGEEVVFVAELLDQGQFGIDALADLRGNPPGPAQGFAPGHQCAQVAVGRMALGHHLFRVLVTQLLQAEVAAGGDLFCRSQQLPRVKALQLSQGAQVPLAVAGAPAAQLLDAGIVSEGGEYIVQRFARRAVHLHVTAGHGRQADSVRQLAQGGIAGDLVVAQQVADAQPHPVLAQPRQLQAPGAAGLAVVLRQPDQQAALEMEDHVPQGGAILSLRAAPARHADQP